ncbi:glutamate dehydrogenase, putative (GDH3) [Plasmodium ovale wallikeri]|uniref:Glutamate dehydrogenase, putative (GDH3) n=1 Tax=Plasmodium ovale wallikeri TaxID=864142 RepID=A0A1A8YHU1_PLAOA|nr:glutamate dehydrogenase, putative (GDH3) [Plasmodium ovale wallikeri]
MDMEKVSALIEPGGSGEPCFSNEPFSNNSVMWKEKYEEVKRLLVSYNLFSDHLINYSIDFYFNKLGFNKYHFEETSSELISKVVVCIITAKINEQYSSDKYFPTFEEKHNNVIFIITRVFADDNKTRLNYKMEKKIEEKYFNFSDMSKDCYRLKSFRSVHSVFDKEHTYQEPLRTYILKLPTYNDDIISENETNLMKLMDVSFYNYIKGTKYEKIYDELNKAVLYDLTGQFIQTHYYGITENTFSLTIAVKRSNVISSIFSLIGDCLNMHRCFSYSKYVEPLKNGVLLIILNVNVIIDSEHEKKSLILEERIYKIVKSLKTLCLFNDSKFIQLSVKRIFTAEECAYIFIIIKFITFFSTNSFASYKNVENALHLRSDNSNAILNDFYIIKEKLKSSKYTKDEILNCALSNVKTIKSLFLNFEKKLKKKNLFTEHTSLLLQTKSSKDIIAEIEDNHHKTILQSFYMFERYAVKTNFFHMHKIGFAVSFDGALLKDSIYDAQPHSIIMTLGLHFVGFHIRFSKISRGGIRIVISNNMNSYMHNYNNLFDEAYNLAYTQNFKNKDIPEGGSKGIILLDADVCNIANTKYIKNLSFYSYVNSILDLLTEQEGDGALFISTRASNEGGNGGHGGNSNKSVALLGNRGEANKGESLAHTPAEPLAEPLAERDLIFLGPDENTGSDQLMDWACIIAKKRKYPFWKTFSTGKLRKNGGVPHDYYGMTTLGIETYIKKLCEKLNIKEENICRSLVGGPDGDLGSNAILQSKTKIISIIDGSGVLYDRNGLNKDELTRLAKRRNSKDNLNTSCMLYEQKYISKDGFKISIEDYNVSIFGKTIKSGLEFRNNFFLNSLNTCDLFNPCGGRPHSINIFNVNNIIVNGECIYKYIVEGANVFISDDARNMLESKNVILFKDASTNKGGVISSSLEVLAGLMLSDKQFIQLMCTPNSDILLVEENEITFLNQNQRRNHSPSFARSVLLGCSDRNKDNNRNKQCDGHDDVGEEYEVTPFYKEYVEEIQKKIRQYCELEFEVLWSETRRTKTPISQATNVLSKKISELKKDILSSDTLCTDRALLKKVLKDVIPPTLLKIVTFDEIFERVPYIYLRSLFASALASNYYYSQEFLNDLSVFNFFEYIRKLQTSSEYFSSPSRSFTYLFLPRPYGDYVFPHKKESKHKRTLKGFTKNGRLRRKTVWMPQTLWMLNADYQTKQIERLTKKPKQKNITHDNNKKKKKKERER